MSTVKKHQIELNNGAMHHLSSLLSRNDLITDVGDLSRACILLETHFLELPTPDEIPDGTDQVSGLKLIREWQRRGSHTMEMTERQRDTCKKIIGEAIKKGTGGGPAVLCLLKQFGLQTEDG